jgi:hypothetical protein
MSCPRGDAAPDQHTKLRLFAASGGYCQNPGFERQLFLDTGTKRTHSAEMAHVFAANNKGPRANTKLSEAERGAFENLILLCSTCHTMMDKAEEDFPDQLLEAWKRDHEARLARIFGAVHAASRPEVLATIEPLLLENRIIFDEYNPDLAYREDPESEMAAVWQRNMRERIIPNSRRVLATLEANRDHMIDGEARTLELFRQHLGGRLGLGSLLLAGSGVWAEGHYVDPETCLSVCRSVVVASAPPQSSAESHIVFPHWEQF